MSNKKNPRLIPPLHVGDGYYIRFKDRTHLYFYADDSPVRLVISFTHTGKGSWSDLLQHIKETITQKSNLFIDLEDEYWKAVEAWG